MKERNIRRSLNSLVVGEKVPSERLLQTAKTPWKQEGTICGASRRPRIIDVISTATTGGHR